jgi:hypothetical protein
VNAIFSLVHVVATPQNDCAAAPGLFYNPENQLCSPNSKAANGVFMGPNKRRRVAFAREV